MGLRARENVEGEGQEAVAGEDGGRLVEFFVCRRLPAPQVVIVHRRQIVVHQRVAVHAFERGAGHQRLRARNFEQARALHYQEWSEPFAATEARIADGVYQAGRPRLLAGNRRRRQKPIQQVVDILCRRFEASQKRADFPVHYLLAKLRLPRYPASGCVYPALYSIQRAGRDRGAKASASVNGMSPTARAICDKRAHSVNGAGDLAVSPPGRGLFWLGRERDDGTAAGQGPWPSVDGRHTGPGRSRMCRRDGRLRCCARIIRARSG